MPTSKLSKKQEQQTLLSLFLGPLLWFLQFNALNILTSVSCEWGWFPFKILGLPGLRFVELIITLVALLLMLYIVYLPGRIWGLFQSKEPAHNPHLLRDTEEGNWPLLASIAMLMNVIFSIIFLGSFVLLFFLKACGSQ